jgi:hypothetical protein
MILKSMDYKDGTALAQDAEDQKLSSKDWLAGDSSYQTFVESLSASDPRLHTRDPKAVAQRIQWRDYGKVVNIELMDDLTFGEPTELYSATSLSDHLLKYGSRPRRRSLYIVEGLGPGFANALGSHFALHPSVFVDHERVIVMNRKAEGESDGVPLPSMLRGRDHVTMKYFEPLWISRRPTSFRLVCGETGRHIGISRADDEFLHVAVVRRKCTMWTKQVEGGGWDCEYFPSKLGMAASN